MQPGLVLVPQFEQDSLHGLLDRSGGEVSGLQPGQEDGLGFAPESGSGLPYAQAGLVHELARLSGVVRHQGKIVRHKGIERREPEFFRAGGFLPAGQIVLPDGAHTVRGFVEESFFVRRLIRPYLKDAGAVRRHPGKDVGHGLACKGIHPVGAVVHIFHGVAQHQPGGSQYVIEAAAHGREAEFHVHHVPRLVEIFRADAARSEHFQIGEDHAQHFVPVAVPFFRKAHGQGQGHAVAQGLRIPARGKAQRQPLSAQYVHQGMFCFRPKNG